MADNDIVRRGYMNVVRNPQGGVLGRVLSVTSRRQWVVLRRESGGGLNRIELYRNEDQSGEPLKTFILSPQLIRNVESLERKKAFVLIMPDNSCMFQCSSRADMEDWHRDIQYYSTGSRSAGHAAAAPASNGIGEIYEVIPDDETFRVRLRKAKTLSFSGPCLLEILRDFERNLFHIGLFSEEELPRLVVKWQIDHIRQYGSNNLAFKFESGSKSSTGVDWFIVDTEPGCAVRIHRSVDYWAKHIVEQLKNIPGGSNAARRSTLPSSSSHIPDNDSCSPSPSSSLPRQGNNTYMTINQEGRAATSVYASPDTGSKPKPKGKSGGRNKPPAPKPTDPTYMALDQRSMDPTQNQTYQAVGQGSAGGQGTTNGNSSDTALYMGLEPHKRNDVTSGGDGVNPSLYMGIDPLTRNNAERQYMALNQGAKDGRSK